MKISSLTISGDTVIKNCSGANANQGQLIDIITDTSNSVIINKSNTNNSAINMDDSIKKYYVEYEILLYNLMCILNSYEEYSGFNNRF